METGIGIWIAAGGAVVAVVALTLFLGARLVPSAARGVRDGHLSDCPRAPHCVSSRATDEPHAIAPLVFPGSRPDMAALLDAVAELPRTRIVTATDRYLHAESRSAVFGFVDDLELWLPAEDDQVEVRSSARWGWSDAGVNRARVERLRQLLGATR